jgi:hypothetical protein
MTQPPGFTRLASMALLHRAVVSPSKLQLLAAWLPTRHWYQGPAEPDLLRVNSYRFDDPDGEVGVETMLVRTEGGPLWQVPLTYRGTPLDGADQWLVGTAEHSVLGPRWVYDGCRDLVYVNTLAHAILTGGRQADEFVDGEDGPVLREPTIAVQGSGRPDADVPLVDAIDAVDDEDPTIIRTGPRDLAVVRVVGETGEGLRPFTLTATWDGQPTPKLLAYLI